MPASLANTTTTANIADTKIGGGGMYGQGSLIVANNPVIIEIDSGPEIGTLHTDRYPYVAPSIIPIIANGDELINAIRFASFDPTKPAQVAGWLLERPLAGLGPANAFTGSISASGGVTPGQQSVQIQKNGVLIGTEPILDFIDNGVLWTLADDGPNTRVTIAGSVPLVTSLPGSPTDGQECVLVDATAAPTYQWRVRYNAAEGKWDFVGGAPRQSSGAGPATINGGAAVGATGFFQFLGFTVPVSGEWEVRGLGTYDPNGAAGLLSIALFGTINIAANTQQTDTFPSGTAGQLMMISTMGIVNASAGQTIGVCHSSSAPGTNTVRNIQQFIVPRHVF